MKTPISLIIDDPAPLVSVYYHHNLTHKTQDGRDLPKTVPVEFLERFADVAEKYGIAGKFSIIPVPGGVGRIDKPMPGILDEEVRRWIKIADQRLGKTFDFCPEINTHHNVWDIEKEVMLDVREDDWCDEQSAETLTPYIAYALQILKNVGIDATGVTSPWAFGQHNEEEYARAIGRAMEKVTGRKDSWYFLRSLYATPHARPWLSVTEGGRRVVAIPGTLPDHMWQTMDTPDTSEEYVSRVADTYITSDGEKGLIPEALAMDSWVIMTTHWQSQFAAGLGTGLRVLETVAGRVEKHLADKVEWTRFSELMRRTLDNEL